MTNCKKCVYVSCGVFVTCIIMSIVIILIVYNYEYDELRRFDFDSYIILCDNDLKICIYENGSNVVDQNDLNIIRQNNGINKKHRSNVSDNKETIKKVDNNDGNTKNAENKKPDLTKEYTREELLYMTGRKSNEELLHIEMDVDFQNTNILHITSGIYFLKNVTKENFEKITKACKKSNSTQFLDNAICNQNISDDIRYTSELICLRNLQTSQEDHLNKCRRKYINNVDKRNGRFGYFNITDFSVLNKLDHVSDLFNASKINIYAGPEFFVQKSIFISRNHHDESVFLFNPCIKGWSVEREDNGNRKGLLMEVDIIDKPNNTLVRFDIWLMGKDSQDVQRIFKKFFVEEYIKPIYIKLKIGYTICF